MTKILHFVIDSAEGLYNHEEYDNRMRKHWVRAEIDTTWVREFALIFENTGSFVGSIDCDYRLNDEDAWTDYQTNLVAGTRYTHLTLDAIFYDQTNAVYLPVAALSLHMDAYTSGSCDVWLILRD